MGMKAQRQRQANAKAARAAKKAKMDATPEIESSTTNSASRAEPVVPPSGPPVTNTKTSTSKWPLRSAKENNVETGLSRSSDTTRRNPPRARNASATISSNTKDSAQGPTASKVPRSQSNSMLAAQPSRKAAVASRTLVQQVAQIESLDSSDADVDLHSGDSDNLQEYDEDEDGSLEMLSDDSDRGLDIGLDENGQLSVVKAAQKPTKAKLAAVPAASRGRAKPVVREVDEDSESDSADNGESSCCQRVLPLDLI